MSAMRTLLARVRALGRNGDTRRLDEEIKQHAEMLAADYVKRGMTEREAHSAAMRDLGNITSMEQEYRDQETLPLLEHFWYDLRFAARSLRRNPTFTAACTTTLAVGLGAMITVFCILSTFLWKPLPYPKANRLVAINEIDPRGGAWPFSEPTLLDIQERSRSLASVAAFRTGSFALTGAGEPEMIHAAVVTPSSFAMFGIKPVIGGALQEKDVVISRGLWKRKWQMNPAVVGRPLGVDGDTYTVAGVADLPEDLLPGSEMLLPLLPKATESRSAHEVQVVGQIRAGTDIRQAQAELNTIAASIGQENPRTNAGWGMRLIPLIDYVNQPGTGRIIWMVFAAVALFWLLACANVAGLQMARSISRRHEMSTRMALGASSRRLFAQTLTESLVLALGGAVLGVALAQITIDAIRQFASNSLPRLSGLHMDWVTIGLALGCMLVSTLLFAMFSGHSLNLQGGRELSRRDRGRDALVVVQVALASVLLLGASLLLHSFLRLRAVNPGFDPEGILTVPVSLPRAYDSARKVAFFADTAERLSRLPEVAASGATNVTPFSGQGTANRFRLEGESTMADFHSAGWRAVTPGFFTTLGLPLKRGRFFTEADREGATEVVILSESMAKQFWPNQDPIGKRLLWGRSGNPKTIVGIVGDLRDLTVDTSPAPMMFRPFSQLSDAPMTMVIRTRGEPAGATADVRRVVWSVDRNAALQFELLRQAMSDSILTHSASLLAVATFAAIAMITAAFGLYGLISYRVNQRQQEIGIRLALGSPTGLVRWGVQKRCLMLVCTGLAVGLPLAYALSTLITSLLYNTEPTQAAAYAVVVIAFAAIALAASYGPARRASRMDPAAALRHE